jgi:hypothetical protein
VRDLTIAGYEDYPGYAGVDSVVNNDPATWNRIIGAIQSTSGTGTSPIVVTTTAAHTLANGNQVEISGILGNTNANGTHTITVTGTTTFTLNSSSPNGNYDANSKGIWKSTSRWPDKYHGLLLKGSGLLVKNVNLFYFPGTALHITDGGAGGPTGPKLPFDREVSRIWDCKVDRAYRGFLIDTNAVVGRLEGFRLRDYGVKFTAPGAQIDGSLHFYGVGGGGVDQPAVWFASGADGCVGGPIYAETSPVTLLIESSGNVLGPIYSHTGFSKNIVIKGEQNTLGPLTVDVPASTVGVTIHDQFNKLIGGSIELKSTSAVGVHIESGGDSGNGLVIRDIRFLGQSATQGTAVTTDAVLNNCTIEAHLQNVGTGIDLNPGGQSKLGNNNTIRITTFQVTTPINLPSSWDDDDAGGSRNRIWIDGVEQTSN